MSSIEDKISSILSDPDAVSKLQSLGAALGLDTSTQEKPQPKETKSKGGVSAPLSQLSSLLTSESDNSNMINTVMRLAPMISDMNKEDDMTRLLSCLRPFLSADRRKRLDEAGKMLRVMKLLPLIGNI